MTKWNRKIKGIIDLTRAHFAPIWPILFCTGLILGFRTNDVFSLSLLIRVALIGLFGFEAGMVWNDILDHDIDHIEPDTTMTKYWRPFKERPIPSGIISLTEARIIWAMLIFITICLIATLPSPNRFYIYGIMIYAYSVETFYNLKKRKQKFPFAQLIGRTDLTIFPIAGYLCVGIIDLNIITFGLLLYPWALAHLGTNDLIDVKNDEAKKLQTITVIFGDRGNRLWNLSFTIIHVCFYILFLWINNLGIIPIIGSILSSLILFLSNYINYRHHNSQKIVSLLLFHVSLFLITSSIIIDSLLILGKI